MSLLARIDKFHGLSAQMQCNSTRVLYSASGTIPAAALLKDSDAVIEHKLYWSEISGETETNYLIATLNSDAIRGYVASRQSRGQWGPRDFDKLLAEAIAEFNPSNPLHLELAHEGARAEKVAARVELSDGIHFIRARGIIRKALREEGVGDRIEKLVRRLLQTGSPASKVGGTGIGPAK